MILQGDALEVLKTLEPESVHTCVTSPPYYGLRDYGLPKTMWPAVDYSPMLGICKLHIPKWEGCLGLEPTIEMFIGHIVLIFREVRRVLRNDGTLWMNFGDSYEEKDLQGFPWRSAFALQADGWFLRSDIIWNKPNPMPESAKDRPTKAHEYMFLLSRSKHYYFDLKAIKEPATYFGENTGVGFGHGTDKDQRKRERVHKDFKVPTGWDIETGSHGSFHKEGRRGKGNAKTFRGGGAYTQGKSFDNDCNVERESHGNAINETGLRNKRDVWTVATQPYPEAHFATFPKELIRPCILAGCPVGGIALDPFFGSGTTGEVALEENRDFIGIELNLEYIELEKKRISNVQVKMII